METRTENTVLIKEKDQFEYEVLCENPNSDIAPDGTGKLIQEYDFSTREFTAKYVPSDEDWTKGIVIIKVDDTLAETTTIIEIKLVEYIFPASIFIKDNKYLKFKKRDSIKERSLNLKFAFKLFYTNDEEEEFLLLERNNNILNHSPSVSILLSDNVINEIYYARKEKYPLLIQIMSNNKDYLDCTLEVPLDIINEEEVE
jgi:hypothetical protein